MDKQKELLKIVRAWKINPRPEYKQSLNSSLSSEYRGFRCADCQKYLHKAFHHYLKYGGFNTPVHFCKNCQKKSGVSDGIFKSFTCDNCGKNMFKAYHIWNKKGGTMIETHFCKNCLRTKGVPF